MTTYKLQLYANDTQIFNPVATVIWNCEYFMNPLDAWNTLTFRVRRQGFKGYCSNRLEVFKDDGSMQMYKCVPSLWECA